MIQTCLPFQQSSRLVERLANAAPIVTPGESEWQGGFTLNAACIRVQPQQTELIASLVGNIPAPDGVVAYPEIIGAEVGGGAGALNG